VSATGYNRNVWLQFFSPIHVPFASITLPHWFPAMNRTFFDISFHRHAHMKACIIISTEQQSMSHICTEMVFVYFRGLLWAFQCGESAVLKHHSIPPLKDWCGISKPFCHQSLHHSVEGTQRLASQLEERLANVCTDNLAFRVLQDQKWVHLCRELAERVFKF